MSIEDEPIQKRSKLRQEIEELLQKKGLVLETGVSAMNLDTGETYRFKDYPELQAFLKGRKGRWYITTPGLRPARETRSEK
ncbi:MAG: hypothetical protein QUS09_04870 [Methanotrichaceae archaeon]|nr:hypothetical protein [Methanotrichaceae archaeon]